jgi:hypothetical protein
LPATSAGSAFGSNSSVFGGGGASAFAASTSAPAAPAFGNPRSPPPPPQSCCVCPTRWQGSAKKPTGEKLLSTVRARACFCTSTMRG